jgi:hypothetical protein
MMYMITHGRIVLSYLQGAIMNGFHSLIVKAESLVRFVIGVGPDISGSAVLAVIIVLNSNRV